MTGIIVTGHGRFSEGITSALELILGKQENYLYVNFSEGDTATELEKNLDDAFQQMKELENIIVFTDLLSGSPFNTCIMKAMSDERIRVFYGTNLAMLIETISERNFGTEFEKLLETAKLAAAQTGIFDAGLVDDDDDFS